MVTYKNRKFTNEDVELDGNKYIRCEFRNCRLIFKGGMPPSMIDCSFYNPNFVFHGAAGHTMIFLTKMYEGGLANLVESWFDQIRGKVPTVM